MYKARASLPDAPGPRGSPVRGGSLRTFPSARAGRFRAAGAGFAGDDHAALTGGGDAFAGLDLVDRLGDRVGGDRKPDTGAAGLRAFARAASQAIWEFTPTTSPCSLSSGPPELPGLSAASVWIAPVILRAVGRGDFAVQRRDDAAREGLVETVRVADRIHRVADLDRARAHQASAASGSDRTGRCGSAPDR